MPHTIPCDICSFRRVKCDGGHPCRVCVERSQICTYLRVRKRRGPKGPRRSTGVKIQDMQRRLLQEQQERLSLLSDSQDGASPITTAPRYQIPLSAYITYLDVFRSRLYPIWPIVAIEKLKKQLTESHADDAPFSLAAALCAATMAQLGLHRQDSSASHLALVDAADFQKECIRIRSSLDHYEEASINALLISLFLHMYYANTGNITAATLSLREAIAYAHMLNLGRNIPPNNLHTESEQRSLRTFWVLFVTERTFCMQHHIPITLKKINILPDIPDSNVDPDVYTGFCRLARLFVHIENRLVQLPSSSETVDDSDENAYSRKRILDIQEQIHCNGIDVSNVPETQCVDLLATSAWLRSLVWQYSASHFMLSTLSPDKPFCPTYPFAIARDFLGFLSGVSDDSIRAHGYGMEIKLLQVANSLLDIVTCVPSVARSTHGRFGPEDAVHTLANLLSKVGGSMSPRLNMLHARMSQARSVIEPTSLSLFLPGQRRISELPAKAGSPYHRQPDNNYSPVDSEASTSAGDPSLVDDTPQVTATSLPRFLSEEVVPTEPRIKQPLDGGPTKLTNLHYVDSAEEPQSHPYWTTSAR